MAIGTLIVVTRLEVWPDMPHVWHLFGGILPEADQVIERIGAFVKEH